MARKCVVCEHEKINEINEALLAGETYRNIAKRFSVSISSLSRHKNQHIPKAMTKAQEAQEVAQADNLLEQVQNLQAKALSILAKAEASGDLRTALTGIREARACLELLAKLQGELQQEGTVNITLAPEWLELRTVILQSLEPWPEARLAIAQAVKEVEGNAG
ncbi:MAG: hypothetical protein ACOX2T_03260 [bacterium]|jgi:hypothetical protein